MKKYSFLDWFCIVAMVIAFGITLISDMHKWDYERTHVQEIQEKNEAETKLLEKFGFRSFDLANDIHVERFSPLAKSPYGKYVFFINVPLDSASNKEELKTKIVQSLCDIEEIRHVLNTKGTGTVGYHISTTSNVHGIVLHPYVVAKTLVKKDCT